MLRNTEECEYTEVSLQTPPTFEVRRNPVNIPTNENSTSKACDSEPARQQCSACFFVII